MLCYAMLCYAMLCYAMLCYTILCYAMLYYAMLYYALLSLPPFLSFFFSSLFSLLTHISLSLPFPNSHTALLYSTHHIISHNILSHHIKSNHITSHHITSYHVTSHHITSGSMPRCMDVICRNEVVEQAKAGKQTVK